MKRMLLPALLLGLVLSAPAQAQEKKAPPAPTAAEVAYSEHARQVLDFWQAKSDTPTPLVLCIHGGSWQGGDKTVYAGAVKQFLDAGISVASINYRYVKNGVELKIEPPVKAPLEDAARALQFIRSKSKEWNLDKKRIGATGGSAGGCSSLWLAFHDDMADPKSSDPVARESTRLYCAAVNGAQTSLDPKDLRDWMPNYSYGGHAFGFGKFQDYYEGREKVLKWIKEYSPIEHVTKDDPPIYMDFMNQKVPPVVGENQKDPTHSAVLGLKLEEKLKATGVECVLIYPGREDPEYKSAPQFLIKRLVSAAGAGDDKGFKPIFNGKDLTGWKTFLKDDKADPARFVVIKDGEIQVGGDPFGYFYTEKSFKNFVLRFSWTYPKDQPDKTTMNSGLLLHVQEPHKIWPKSVEPQGRYKDHGKLFFIGFGKDEKTEQKFDEAAQQKALKASHEWNATEVTARGDGSIEVRINGMLINTGKSELTSGPIGFQSEGARIHFKDILIKSLD